MFSPQIDSTDIYTMTLSFVGATFAQMVMAPAITTSAIELYLLDLVRSLSISLICAVVGFLLGRYLKQRFPNKKR